MNIQRYAKEEIAARLIETALELFFLEGELFAIVTLAGAAEQILGQLLEARKQGAGLADVLQSVLSVLRPASRKQKGSEWLASHETDAYVHTDVYQEALFLLGRAIDDYLDVTGKLTDRMLVFNERYRLKTEQ
jgi:hypothetical protein